MEGVNWPIDSTTLWAVNKLREKEGWKDLSVNEAICKLIGLGFDYERDVLCGKPPIQWEHFTQSIRFSRKIQGLCEFERAKEEERKNNGEPYSITQPDNSLQFSKGKGKE